jgi:hypothetical protein
MELGDRDLGAVVEGLVQAALLEHDGRGPAELARRDHASSQIALRGS